MNPLTTLRRTPHRAANPSVDQRHRARERVQTSRHGKPTLSADEYMEELNDRLQRHPMYLEGMHFPYPQPGSTPMLAAALAWEGPWDCMGVFSSVIEDVRRDYDLAPGERVRLGQYDPPASVAPSHEGTVA